MEFDWFEYRPLTEAMISLTEIGSSERRYIRQFAENYCIFTNGTNAVNVLHHQ